MFLPLSFSISLSYPVFITTCYCYYRFWLFILLFPEAAPPLTATADTALVLLYPTPDPFPPYDDAAISLYPLE